MADGLGWEALSKRFAANFVQSLAAVLAGNAVYFLLMPFLPLWARHAPFRTDPGLAVDGGVCLLAYGVLQTLTGRNHGSKLRKR